MPNRTVRMLEELSSSIARHISVLWIVIHYESQEKALIHQRTNTEIIEKILLSDNPELLSQYLHLMASAEIFYNTLSQEIKKTK